MASRHTAYSKKRRYLYTTKRWKHLARDIKLKEPFCRVCKAQGRITLATQVDHIIPRFKGGDDWNLDNLQPICHPCHVEKSRKEKPRNHIPKERLNELLNMRVKYKNPQERIDEQKNTTNKEKKPESKSHRPSTKRRDYRSQKEMETNRKDNP